MAKLRYFKLSEFACKCGCGRHKDKMDFRFLNMLDEARTLARVPFKITSGYRCPSYNISVGGKKGSAHTKGKAADIYVPNSEARIRMIQALLDVGFERLGVGNDYIHADDDMSRAFPVMWTYYKVEQEVSCD